jgi:hypothetical protein
MNHVSCPACQLRFTPAQAAGLPSCPTCGGPLQTLAGPAAAMGFRLFESEPDSQPLPEAIAVAMPTPGPLDGRS